VRDVAGEGQGVARPKHIDVAPMAIVQHAGEQMNELDAGMLKTREHLAAIVQRHQKGLEDFARAALGGQKVIGMSAAGAAAHRLEPLTGADQLGAAVVDADSLHQGGRRDAQGSRQGDNGFQAGGDSAGLEPAQHGAADIGTPRHVGPGSGFGLSRKRRAVRPRSTAGLCVRSRAGAGALSLRVFPKRTPDSNFRRRKAVFGSAEALHNTQMICSTVKISFIFSHGNPLLNLCRAKGIPL